jgi:hypothetical protein
MKISEICGKAFEDDTYENVTAPILAVLILIGILYFALVRTTNHELNFYGNIVSVDKKGEFYKIQAMEDSRVVIIEFSTENFRKEYRPDTNIIGDMIKVAPVALTTNKCTGYYVEIKDRDFNKIFGGEVTYTLDAFWQKKNKQFAQIY